MLYSAAVLFGCCGSVAFLLAVLPWIAGSYLHQFCDLFAVGLAVASLTWRNFSCYMWVLQSGRFGIYRSLVPCFVIELKKQLSGALKMSTQTGYMTPDPFQEISRLISIVIGNPKQFSLMDVTITHSSAAWFGTGGTSVATQTEQELPTSGAEQTVMQNSWAQTRWKVSSTQF